MAIYRTQHNQNYTVVNNTIVKDNRLSWKAKGIWLYAFSRPDDWEFHENDIIKQSTDGRDSVRAGLKELEDMGYLVRIQTKEKGKFSSAEWIFHETPQELKKCLPKTENPSTEKPTTENRPLLSTEIKPNTDLKNDDDDRARRSDFPKEKEQEIPQSESDIIITKTNGQQERISVSDIYRYLLPFNFATATIQEAIKRIRETTTPINNAKKYIESTCRQIETVEQAPEKSPKKPKNKPVMENPFPVDSNQKTIRMSEYLKQKGLTL